MLETLRYYVEHQQITDSSILKTIKDLALGYCSLPLNMVLHDANTTQTVRWHSDSDQGTDLAEIDAWKEK